MRRAWAPHCQGPHTTLTLHGGGRITIKSATVPAWLVLNDILKKHNYQTHRAQTGAYNCRVITGGSNYSLHAYGIAADLNWSKNPYSKTLRTDMPGAMVAEIKAIRTMNGKRVFRWGGDYRGNKDAMHYEIICTPRDLASGIHQQNAIPPADLGQVLRTLQESSRGTPLKRGDNGPRVGQLQWVLNQKAGQGLIVDGDFGPATEASVNNALRMMGRPENGVADSEVWQFLFAAPD